MAAILVTGYLCDDCASKYPDEKIEQTAYDAIEKGTWCREVCPCCGAVYQESRRESRPDN